MPLTPQAPTCEHIATAVEETFAPWTQPTNPTELQLYTSLATTLGEQEAAALVSSIATSRWDDVVTRDHLDARLGGLQGSLASKAEVADLRSELQIGFARQRRELQAALRSQLIWMLTTMLTLTGVIIAAFAALR